MGSLLCQETTFRSRRISDRRRSTMFRATSIVTGMGIICLLVGCNGQSGNTSEPSKSPSTPYGMASPSSAAGGTEWAVTLDNIEACSCPAFCQCYFTGQPALHEGQGDAHAMRFCRFNNAFKVAKGHY